MLTAEALQEAVRAFSPDILHAFHAVRCGAVASGLSQQTGHPYILTLTGTELYGEDDAGFTDNEQSQFENAAALIAFHEVIGNRLTNLLPELTSRLEIIPQGVEVPEADLSTPLAESPFVFLLPAGIRPVKNILFCLRPLEQLSHSYPQIKLFIAGPVLDDKYFAELQGALARYPFASWLGEVSNAAMPALYRSAHVILNTSLSEGGMANSILEGMAYNKPVLVSDVEGNRSLIADGENGFLYLDEADFLRKAERLLLDEGMRRVIGAKGREYVASHCSPELEAQRYLDLYIDILKRTKGSECIIV